MSQNLYVSLQDDERILCYDIDESNGSLREHQALEVPGGPAPLALSPDGSFLYAGLRGKAGLAWLRRDTATGLLESGGSLPLETDPCFIATDRRGRFLLSACYRAGLVGVHRIGADGSIVAPAVEWRATAVNAHMMQTDPADRFALVPHTGPNLILQFRFDAATGRLTPNEVPRAAPPEGVGPRHFCFHPGGRLVVFSNELASSVSSYAYDPAAGTLELLDTLSTLPAGFKGSNTCAQIHMSPDGRFVYVSNRGHDSIAAVALAEDGGRLRLIENAPSERVPRAFNLDLDGRWLYAAGQESGRLATYAVGRDGRLTQTGTLPLGRKPLWVLAARRPSGVGARGG
jgi:6-phosphogluconolactonase